MRKTGFVLFIALLALTGSLTGCFGKNKSTPGTDTTGNGGTPTPPSPTPTGTPTATPTTTPTTTPTPTTGGGGNTTTKPADINATVKLTLAAGTGDPTAGANPPPTYNPTTAKLATITSAGWKTFTVTVTTTALQGDSVKITVKDAKGKAVGTTTITGDPNPTAALPKPASITVSATEPGAYSAVAEWGNLGNSGEFTLLTSVKY